MQACLLGACARVSFRLGHAAFGWLRERRCADRSVASCPGARVEDGLGTRWEVHGGAFVVGAVGDLVTQDQVGVVPVAFGAGDGGEVEVWDLVGGGSEQGGLGRGASGAGVAVAQGVGGDEVGDVDDGAAQAVIEAVSFVEPGPGVTAELAERGALDEVEGPGQVADAVLAAGLAAGAQAAEDVGVDEQVLDLVDRDAAALGFGGVAGVGQVRLAGAGVGTEPVAHGLGVAAGLGGGDAHCVGELVGGGAVGSGGQVGQDAGHVRLAHGERGAAGAGRHRPEHAQAGQGAVVGEPCGDVGVEGGVGVVQGVAHGGGDLGGEGGRGPRWWWPRR